MEDLKPCPFCGKAPSLDDCRTIWAVRCDCGVCMLGERAPEPNGNEPPGYWDRIRQTAIDAWNRRAPTGTADSGGDAVAWAVIGHDGKLLLAEQQTLLAYFDTPPRPLVWGDEASGA